MANETNAAQLSGDINSRNCRLLVLGDDWDIWAGGNVSQANSNRAHGTLLGATCMANASRSMNDMGDPIHQAQHAVLRASGDTARATDAELGLNYRVLR